MAKKSGLLTLLTGVVAGAAAVFFSDEKNRQKAKKELCKASESAKAFKKKLDQNPDAAIDEAIDKVELVAKKQARRIKRKATKFVASRQPSQEKSQKS